MVPKVTGKNKHHPFDKPAELVEKVAGRFPQGRVLDPFCGAGGLLVGAYRLGWDVVGVDISREFCDMSEMRLSGVAPAPVQSPKLQEMLL